MMKNILFTVLALFAIKAAFAQTGSDSVAYRLERAKINAMLANRTRKFGDYDQSLTRHTGIFGLQTKKDIRRSNDILMDIVKTDDDIYTQIKILLDFRTFQQQQAQSKSEDFESTRIGYMTTINKLRDEVDKLKADAAKQQTEYDEIKRNLIIAIIIASLSILLVLRRFFKPAPVAKPKATQRKRK